MKIRMTAVCALLICAFAFASAAAYADDISAQDAQAETCTIDIQGAQCFFVYYGKADPVPSKLEKGSEIDFNIMFKGGASKPYVVLKANGKRLGLTDGKYYSYTVNEDTVFTVETFDEDPDKPVNIGPIILAAGGVSLVAVIVIIVITNKKAQTKQGRKNK